MSMNKQPLSPQDSTIPPMKRRKCTTSTQSINGQLQRIDITKKAVIYARCSTKAQDISNQNHCSLSTQVGICTSYCEKEGYEILCTETEIVSARHFEKQKKLLGILEHYEHVTLIVADCSRLSRDFYNAMIFLQHCNDKSITVVSVRENLTSNRTFDRRTLIDITF